MSNDVTAPSTEQIQQRADELYIARGCEPGRDLDDWLAAEAELMLEIQAEVKPARAIKASKAQAMAVGATPPA